MMPYTYHHTAPHAPPSGVELDSINPPSEQEKSPSEDSSPNTINQVDCVEGEGQDDTVIGLLDMEEIDNQQTNNNPNTNNQNNNNNHNNHNNNNTKEYQNHTHNNHNNNSSGHLAVVMPFIDNHQSNNTHHTLTATHNETAVEEDNIIDIDALLNRHMETTYPPPPKRKHCEMVVSNNPEEVESQSTVKRVRPSPTALDTEDTQPSLLLSLLSPLSPLPPDIIWDDGGDDRQDELFGDFLLSEE